MKSTFSSQHLLKIESPTTSKKSYLKIAKNAWEEGTPFLGRSNIGLMHAFQLEAEMNWSKFSVCLVNNQPKTIPV